ncbi:hypothetical protein EWF20_10000 [Sulfolobus sp. S-194]|uniref:hypothetical protein n=1 Tax=Sulfolobus sp. S-194 TaxID=2512240 RepID=UPI001436F708|nr:hypothetical protein [Sulfolobus sp. S-194]QIW24453.1 hypothetical protein EWF20_10000 [Sulfolobus sp. S-194]
MEDFIDKLSNVLVKLYKGEPLTEEERTYAIAIFETVAKYLKTWNDLTKKIEELKKKVEIQEEEINRMIEYERELKKKLQITENKLAILEKNVFLLPKN